METRQTRNSVQAHQQNHVSIKSKKKNEKKILPDSEAIAQPDNIRSRPTRHAANNQATAAKQLLKFNGCDSNEANSQDCNKPRASRSHQNQQTSTKRRSRSISSSCSRRSPLFSAHDDQSDSEEQTIRLRCPIDGCDSTGHLSGKFGTHFSQSTCPVFHNMTPKECQDRYLGRLRGRRLDLVYAFNTKSETNCISSSQSPKDKKISKNKTQERKDKSSETLKSDKVAFKKLVDRRKRDINHLMIQNNTPQKRQKVARNHKREPNLDNLSIEFDYEMFREAQSKAAEQLQDEAKDVKMRYGIKCIDLGNYEIDVWYGSPYPEEYRFLPKLYICEYCLKYMTSGAVSHRHVKKCPLKHPPGNEIYRKGNLSFFEVDGQQNEIYCQNLCLLAKLFLDHKTLYFDVAPFLFYVLTEHDEEGFHILGYFSKEKNSFLNYNVSCILTLPPYQKQGYGKLLIDLSYLLTRLEGKVGSPEKPLSDMGLISYRSYWKLIILDYLCNYKAKEISIRDISQETGVNAYDIISTLQAMGMLKYWKGKHLILTCQEILDDYRVNKRKMGGCQRIDPSCLKWTPP